MITEQQPEYNDPHKQKHPPMRTSETEATLNDLLQKVPMTAEILFYKQRNSNINIQWINWAIEMLQAGYETENLIILAGEDIHCNPFEFTTLTNKIFEELHLNKINITDRVFIIYSTYLIKQAVQSPNKEKISEVLLKLEQLCVDTEYNSTLYDFYLLSNAIGELKSYGIQWYWNDATLTKENWYGYTLNYFEQWINTPIQENKTGKSHDFNEKIPIPNPSKKNMLEKLISYFHKKLK